MKQLSVSIAVASLFALSQSLAIEIGQDVTLKGFGTVGAVHSNSSEADFLSDITFRSKGVGNTRTTSYNIDTKAGVQVDWKATPRLSLTGQLLAKQGWDNTYTPELEWAFAKFSILPSLDLRVGRIRPAIYMLSDFIDVNYANIWVRPPFEFYVAAPLARMEGVDLIWLPSIGDVTLLVQPYFGNTKLNLTSSPGTKSYLKADRITGFNLTASKGDLTFRLGYIQTSMSIQSLDIDNGMMAAFNAICGIIGDPAACTQGTALAPYDKKAKFSSFGATYDNGDYLISGEFGKRTTDMFIADATTWYVTAGKRIEQWTPYLTYSSFRNDSLTQFSGGAFPGSAEFGLPSTNDLVNMVLLNNPMDQHTLSLGVRYDVMQNLAIKAQWDHIKTEPKSGIMGTGGGLFGRGNTMSEAFSNNSNQVNLISVSLDFVF